MKLRFQLRIMLIAVSKEKWRMTLAIGAAALGLAAVMILTSLSAGAKGELRAVLAQIGINVLAVNPKRIQAISNRGGNWYLSERLRAKDIESIGAQVKEVRAIVPEVEETAAVKYNGAALNTTVKGVGVAFPTVRNYEVASGRFFSALDEEKRRPVAVLGSYVVDKLNDGFSMLGETLWVKGIAFEVIGQFKSKGLSEFGTNYDDVIVVPYGAGKTRLYGRDYLDRILLLPKEGADIDATISEVGDILRINHRIADDEESDFSVVLPVTTDRAKRTSNELLGGIAIVFTGITLLIGGVGIFSVSYLNVSDRRGEIGLRIALGATRRNIVILFILEALLLSTIGCALGLLSGAASILVMQRFSDWRLAYDLSVFGLPALLSVVLGLFFGVLPAYKASTLLPAEALRSD